MTVDHRQHHLETVRTGLSVTLYPLHYLIALPGKVSEWFSDSLSTSEQLLEENERLRIQHLLLQARLQKLAALEQENIRLRELFDASLKVGDRVLIAELVGVDFEPFSRQILINKGQRHDVFIGQPILDANGIMGQIVHVSPLSSTAMLITDPSHAIPVRINRNGQRAIAVGTGAPGQLEIPHLPNNADIQAGDLLISSGLGGRFPSGYPVAIVSKVERDPGQAFLTVTAEPTAHLERNREVLLVWEVTKLTGADTHCDTASLDCDETEVVQ